MLDARAVQRLLEKIQGMTETAEHVGMRSGEGIQRELRLSDTAKAKLVLLYREHALRNMLLYARLGLVICDTLQDEMEDGVARGQLDLFRANFNSMAEHAKESFDHDIGAAAKLD